MVKLKSLYKYYTIESGIKTLSEGKIKWSSPLLYNDPFDNQIDIQIKGDINEFNIGCSKLLENYILGKEYFKNKLDKETLIHLQKFNNFPKQLLPLLKVLAMKQKSCTQERLDILKESISIAMKSIFEDTAIFCLSETYTNILMWSHYAGNHTGIVINFKDYPKADSPIKLAQKVKYSKHFPSFKIEDIISRNYDSIEVFRDAFTLTKANCWKYEKEWRIVTSMRNPKNKFEIIPFAPQEIQNIYLGCNINPKDERNIIQITKQKYPWAKIYKSHKSTTQFKLEFEAL